MTIRQIIGNILLASTFTAGVLAAAPARADGTKYGALAYSEAKHKWGWARDKDSKQDAEMDAVKACGSEACTIRLTFHDGCAAYAEGEKNIHYGWARGVSLPEAEKLAVKECESHGGKGCTVRVQSCMK